MKNPFSFYLNWRKKNNKSEIVNQSPFIKIISWLLIVSMLNLFSGCMNYFKVRKSTGSATENIDSFTNQNKTIILHLDDKAWILENIEVKENVLTGIIPREYKTVLTKPVKPTGSNRYKTKKPFRQSAVLNEVHIYASEMDRLPDSYVSVPLSSIQKIDVYEKDQAATFGSWTLGILGGSAAAFGLFMIILILTKSSCPFIYTFDGEQYVLAGEIYSGSIQPQLERHDYLKLPVYNSGANDYQIKIANEVKEIQNTNLMELWVFDHSSDLNLWMDKYGNYHTVKNLVSAVSASNLSGTDVINLLGNKDSLYYSSGVEANELPLTDGVILSFPKPENVENAKLVIRAKNSFVLDYMIGQFQNQFGDLYGKWNKKQQKTPSEKLRQWTLDQNIPLQLSVERNGNWEPIDYYNIAGPMAFKEDILSIPLNGNESNPIKVKLESGNFFWEIDYAGIDYSADLELNYHVVKASSAINEKGKDVKKQIISDDNRYYIQPEVGNNAIVSFKIPENLNESQSVFLHSKGWYQILRNPSGTPDREYLETFRQPGQFNRFVNDYIQSAAKK